MTAPQPSPASAPSSADLTGTTIGRYYVRSLLGVGGQGEVYCADDLKLNRTVALKRLSPTLRSDERYRQRFLREAQRASGLNDVHIAGIYDVLEHEGELLLVMEYVQGVSLRQRLAQPLPLSDFLMVATQACEALIAAHASGVVHRDIKPENIMLSRSGRVKVLDFGVAKRLPEEKEGVSLDSTETKAGEISGTPAYMAPELLLHQESDGRADIFSLGVVFYELLTGRHPFLVPGLVATVDRILHEKPKSIIERNPAVPPALEQIVFKMLAKTPAQRYASAQELLADLSALSPAPAGRIEHLVWRARKYRIAMLVALAVAVALLGLGLARRYWSSKPPVFAERDWVLIADPENTTGQPIFNDSLREALTIALQQSQYVNVFPRQRIFDALERMKRTGVDRIDENLGRELCQRENVRVMLASSIRSSGEALQITVRALRPGSGDLLFAESEQFQRKEEFFDRVDAIAKRVRSALGESTPRVHASSVPLEKVTTRSLEALQLYSQASEAWIKSDMERVPALLQVALQLDPGFAMAHQKLGLYYASMSGLDEKAMREMKRAFELREGLSQRERLQIEASYYSFLEQFEKQVEALSLLVGLYPDDAEANYELGFAYSNAGQVENAIPSLRRSLKLNPFSGLTYDRLVISLARNNQADEALAIAAEAQKRGLNSPYLHWAAGLAYLGEDNVAKAREEFLRISGDKNYHSLGDFYLTRLDLYEGKFASALKKLEAGLAAEKGSGRAGPQRMRHYAASRTYLLVGNQRQALHHAELILGSTSEEVPAIYLFWAGRIYANAGQRMLARRVLQRLDVVRQSNPSSWNNSSFHNLEGEIALSEGQTKKAIRAFEAARSEYPQFMPHWGLARAYAAERQWKTAASEWQKVLNYRGEILQNEFPADLTIATLGLARAYRNLKESGQARIHYEKFLRSWREADDFPLRRQAMKEFSNLSR